MSSSAAGGVSPGLGLAEAAPPRRLTRRRHFSFPRDGLGARQLLWSHLPDGEDGVGEEQDRLLLPHQLAILPAALGTPFLC